jgi:hypothetical protein
VEIHNSRTPLLSKTTSSQPSARTKPVHPHFHQECCQKCPAGVTAPLIAIIIKSYADIPE